MLGTFELSTYFSFSYILFLLTVILLYACLPQKLRRLIMLISSYVFFYSISGFLLIYLVVSTISIYIIGLILSKIQHAYTSQLEASSKKNDKALYEKSISKQRWVVLFAVALQIGTLLILKYSSFAITNINLILEHLSINIHFSVPKFLIPIGISFYTLQAVSYVFDVYRNKIQADTNLLRVALYMSFFPQIMEGPICKYSETANLLWAAERIHYSNFTLGLQRILFGIMKKMVVADRLNLYIETIFLYYNEYDGFVIAIAVVGYTFQLYMDFSGTMDVVIGSAQIFGIVLPENFQRPFFSKTISEFWKRWHITLGAWFKDYIFYPLSMTKPLKKLTSKARKKLGNHYGPLLSGAIALSCVWLCNGLWHGVGWHYIFFGIYHFVIIMLESILEPVASKLTAKLHIDRNCIIYRCLQCLRTGLLVCIGELFFRAFALRVGFTMLKKIFTDFTLATLRDKSLFTFGLDQNDFFILLVCVLIFFIIGMLQEKGIHIRESISKKNLIFQFAVYYLLIFFTIIFGAYGAGYVPVDPIYAGF